MNKRLKKIAELAKKSANLANEIEKIMLMLDKHDYSINARENLQEIIQNYINEKELYDAKIERLSNKPSCKKNKRAYERIKESFNSYEESGE